MKKPLFFRYKANLYVAVELKVFAGSLCHLVFVDAIDTCIFALCLFGSNVALYKVNDEASPVSVLLNFGLVFASLLLDGLCDFFIVDFTVLERLDNVENLFLEFGFSCRVAAVENLDCISSCRLV